MLILLCLSALCVALCAVAVWWLTGAAWAALSYAVGLASVVGMLWLMGRDG